MELCVCALLFFTCALATHVNSQQLSPECPQNAGNNCKQETWNKRDQTKFIVSGKPLIIETVKGKLFRTSCSEVVLDDPARPRFAEPQTFKEVMLHHCLPIGSYAAKLRALNVNVNETLSLTHLPSDGILTSASFKDFNPTLKTLKFSSDTHIPLWNQVSDGLDPVVYRQPAVLETDALDIFNGLATLELNGVTMDKVPTVAELKISASGITRLPEGAFEVLDHLYLDELYLTSINETIGPHIQKATFHLPSLVSLTLRNVTNQLLKSKFITGLTSLRVLELRRVKTEEIPTNFLVGLRDLNNFTFTKSDIRSLPQDMFKHENPLVLIDLSDNKLEALSSYVFAGVANSLRVLRLSNNHLNAYNILAVTKLKVLLGLDLSGNEDLWNLCLAEENPLVLPQLQELSLARTGVTLCPTWMHQQSLQHLDLRGNFMKSPKEVFCSHFRIKRGASLNISVVDIRDSPVKRLDCNGFEDMMTDDDYQTMEQVLLVTDPHFDCSCTCPFVLCIQGGVVHRRHI